MGTGWIRWDSLLPKQLLHSTVFEEVALSVRITLGAGGEKNRGGKAVCLESNSSAPRPKAVSVQGLNPHLV